VSRIKVVQHKGKEIITMDFAGLRPGDEFRAGIEEARRLIAARPAKAVRTLFDATGATYNAEMVGVLKEFTKHNEPYVRASAVLGIEGVLSIALVAISRFSGRVFKTFKDRQAALDWLVEQ